MADAKKPGRRTLKPVQNFDEIKYTNLKLIYDLINEKHLISRIDLARETGMSATSMTRICNALISMGLVRESEKSKASAGRSAILLQVIPDACYSYCISIDLPVMQLAIFDMLLNRIAYREVDTHPEMTPEQVITLAAETLPQMAQSAGVPREAVAAVGISSVGSINEGIMLYVAQFNWTNVDAKAYAEQIFNLPVIIENDCKSALIGEQRVRYGLNSPSNIVYLGMEERGVGAAVMLNGKLLRGSGNAAGEIGHITAEMDGMLCDCGRRGCLQTFLAEQFILRRAAQKGLEASSMKDILDALANQNPVAEELLEQMNRYIGVALNIIACAYNPSVIIFNDHYFLGDYHAWYKKSSAKMPYYIFRPVLESAKVESSILGANANLYGIACILQDTLLQQRLGNANIKTSS